MGTDLFKVSAVLWAVRFTPSGQKLGEEEPTVLSFPTVDQAADYLQDELKIHEDQVDAAIVDLATSGTTHAVFGAGLDKNKGPQYIGSDYEHCQELKYLC